MNYGRHLIVALPYMDPSWADLATSFRSLVDIGYWVMPKPADMGIVLAQMLQEGDQLRGIISEFEVVIKHGQFDPLLSV
jgi:hypothetical protein